MPLSVSQRRLAVRQFVADRHGRPDDRRLEGPQLKRPDPVQPILVHDDEVVERRQQAVARVRQRRAERALEGFVNQDRCRDVIKTSAVLEEDIDGGRSLEREASEAKERLEPKEGIIRLKPPEAARGFPTSRVVTAASDESDQSPARETANAVEEDGWSPPPRPSMPAMPGPPGISGTADGIASTLPPSIVSMDSSLMEGSDDVDAELPRAESPAGPVEILPQGSRFGEPVLSVPAATPLVPFVLKGPPPSCTKEDRVKALKYAAVVPPSAKKSLHRAIAALPTRPRPRAIDGGQVT